MSFHERIPFDAREEREIDREVVISKSYEKAVTCIKEAEIDTQQFASLYGATAVQADTTYVKSMEQKFSEEGTVHEAQKLGTIFEAILHEQIAYGTWLGKNSKSQKTSRFDDIKNGIDEVVEIEVDETATSYLGLALDATLGSTLEKLTRIKSEIDSERLGTVKYFRSKRGDFRGELSQIPRAVITTDAKTIVELATLWLEKKHKELRAHPLQQQVVEEIALQLEQFEHYARETGKEAIAETFARSRAVIGTIQKEKEEQFPRTAHGGIGVGKIKGHLNIFKVQ